MIAMPKRIPILLLFSLLTFPAVLGQDVVVEASLDSSMIWIGNPTTMRLSVSAPRDLSVVFPDFKADTLVRGIQVLKRGRWILFYWTTIGLDCKKIIC